MRRLLARKPGDVPIAPPKRETAAELQAELEKILASPEFRGSKRCRTFLRHVVEKTLAGQAGELKERTLAIELYGRPADADLEHDSAVRVCARHVRLRLERYYASSAAAGSRWRIELPPGTYAPAFLPVAAEANEEAPQLPQRTGRLLRLLPVGLAAALVALLLAWRFWPSPSGPLDRFWDPALAARHADVFLTHSFPGNTGPGQPAALQAAAAAEMLHFFRRRNCTVQIRSIEEISRNASPGSHVVIGLPSSDIASQFLKDAPFRVIPGPSPELQFAREQPGEWLEQFRQDARNSAVVYRIPGAADRPFTVVIAGLSAAATLAAARVVSTPDSMARLLQDAPPEWDRSALAALVLFPGGEHARFRLLSARPWQMRPPAP